MRRISEWVIIVFLLLLMVSCGNMQEDSMNALNGIAFDYYESTIIDGEEYDVFLPNDYNEAVLFAYESRNIVSTSETWIINFPHKIKYIADDSTVLTSEFEEFLFSINSLLQEKLGYGHIYSNNYLLDAEFVIENPNLEEIGCGIVEYYFPIRLSRRYEMNNILIPIHMDYLIIKGENIQSIDKTQYISMEDFFDNPYLLD